MEKINAKTLPRERMYNSVSCLDFILIIPSLIVQ